MGLLVFVGGMGVGMLLYSMMLLYMAKKDPVWFKNYMQKFME
jgi:type IV secretory pathway TrbD component